MNLLETLDRREYTKLLKFPVYISLLAANADGVLDETEKKKAVDVTHTKTYSSDPLLTDFYTDVERDFEQNLEELDNQLPRDRKARNQAINNALQELESIITKLDDEYASLFHKSMKLYADQVSKAHNNVLASFIIPFNIKGLTDNN